MYLFPQPVITRALLLVLLESLQLVELLLRLRRNTERVVYILYTYIHRIDVPKALEECTQQVTHSRYPPSPYTHIATKGYV